jgi:hypothetical protein
MAFLRHSMLQNNGIEVTFLVQSVCRHGTNPLFQARRRTRSTGVIDIGYYQSVFISVPLRQEVPIWLLLCAPPFPGLSITSHHEGTNDGRSSSPTGTGKNSCLMRQTPRLSTVSSSTLTFSWTDGVIVRASEWGFTLDRKGKIVATTDLLIASAAYQQAVILHSDSHFEVIANEFGIKQERLQLR